MIAVNGVTRFFGDFKAVDDISFKVTEGEVLGFLGPNGAGKSTTMKMITGFLTPSQGQIKVNDHDVVDDPLPSKASMGYLPEGAPAYGDMTPLEFLTFIADIRGLTGAYKRKRLDYVMSTLHLEAVATQTIETLSKGFKRRVGLAQAIIHDPNVLILDEPTDGLDPNQKHEVRTLIQSLSKEKIVIISTHILEEVSAVCTRAIIISEGKLVTDESPKALVARSRYHHAVTMTLDVPIELSSELKTIEGVKEVEVTNLGKTYTLIPHETQMLLPRVQSVIANKSLPILELSLEQGRLDEVFRQMTMRDSA